MNLFKNTLKTFTGIIAVILCFIIFTLEMGLFFITSTKSYLTKKNIQHVVHEINIDTLLEDEEGNKTEFAQDLYSGFEGVTEQDVDKILSSAAFKEMMGEYVSSSIRAILYNENVKKPTIDELVRVIEDNFSIFEEIAKQEGKTLTESDKEEIINQIRSSNIPQALNEMPDITSELKKENSNTSEVINIIQKVYDIKYILIGFASIVVLVAIIGLIRFNRYSWMLWFAVTTIVSSSLIILLSLVSKPLINFLLSDVSFLTFINNTILPSLFTRLLISGIIGLVISIGLIVLYSFISKKLKTNA